MLTERRFVLLQSMVLIPVLSTVVLLVLSQRSARKSYELGTKQWAPVLRHAESIEHQLVRIHSVVHDDTPAPEKEAEFLNLETHLHRSLSNMERTLPRGNRSDIVRCFLRFRDASADSLRLERRLLGVRTVSDPMLASRLHEQVEEHRGLVRERRLDLLREIESAARTELETHAAATLTAGLILMGAGCASGAATLLLGTFWVRESRRRIERVREHLSRLADEPLPGPIENDIDMVEAALGRLASLLEDRRRLSDKLARVAQEWTESFDAVASPMLVVDAEGHIVRLNRAASHLARADFGQLVGRRLEEVSADEPWSTAARLHRDLEPLVFAQQPVRTDSSLWEIYAHAGHERRTLVFIDRTAIDRLQNALRQSEMMAELGTLVGGVAHEVRNPLFGLSATLDALETEEDTASALPEYLPRLRHDLDRLKKLMWDLLAFGRPRRVSRAPVDLPELIRGVVVDLKQESIAQSVEVSLHVRTSSPVVPGNRDDLVVAVRNVIDNAIRHSQPGQAVDVSLASVNGHLELKVSDRGNGFPPDDLDKVFRPFFSRRKGGTGLGLALVQKITEIHGGRVSAANSPEGGGTITMELPVCSPGEVGAEQGGPDA